MSAWDQSMTNIMLTFMNTTPWLKWNMCHQCYSTANMEVEYELCIINLEPDQVFTKENNHFKLSYCLQIYSHYLQGQPGLSVGYQCNSVIEWSQDFNVLLQNACNLKNGIKSFWKTSRWMYPKQKRSGLIRRQSRTDKDMNTKNQHHLRQFQWCPRWKPSYFHSL